jgi:hypothetical protein
MYLLDTSSIGFFSNCILFLLSGAKKIILLAAIKRTFCCFELAHHATVLRKIGSKLPE